MNPLNNSWIKLPRSFTSWRWYHDSKMVLLLLLRRIRAYPQEISVLAFKSYHKPVISRFTQAIKEPL